MNILGSLTQQGTVNLELYMDYIHKTDKTIVLSTSLSLHIFAV